MYIRFLFAIRVADCGGSGQVQFNLFLRSDKAGRARARAQRKQIPLGRKAPLRNDKRDEGKAAELGRGYTFFLTQIKNQ
jgi:hypothetical protein